MRTTVQQLCSGLSVAGRAVVTTTLALNIEAQQEYVPIAQICATLGLTASTFAAIEEEVYADGAAWSDCCGGFTTELTAEILRRSMGPPVRPTPQQKVEIERAVFAVFDRRCVWCGDDRSPLQMDHIVPIARGGSNHHLNFAPACVRCNQSRGARLLGEWTLPARVRP